MITQGFQPDSIFQRCLKMSVGTLLTLPLAVLPAIAEYTPPKDRSVPSGSITTTGSRGGCNGESPTSLTVLAPMQHTGQTIASHPVFVWHVPEQTTIPTLFQLYSLISGDKQLMYSTQIESQPGLMQWSLPKHEPGLTAGRRYFWQVVLLCDPNRPSMALIAGANIGAIAPPASLSTQLSTIHDPRERSKLYAQASLWYDALAEITAPQFLSHRHQMLQELADLEAASEDATSGDQSQKLQQLLSLERPIKPNSQSAETVPKRQDEKSAD